MPNSDTDTVERKRGNESGFVFFIAVLRLFGIKHARRFAAMVCFYYLLFDWSAVRKSLPYVRHAYPGAGFLKRLFRIHKLFYSQACMLLDRSSFLCGLTDFDHDCSGYEIFRHLAEETDEGVLLLGAHFGNWQLAVEGLKSLNCNVNIVVHEETNEAAKRYLEINSEDSNINYIFTNNMAHGSLEIASALCNGEVVCLMGDRSYGSETIEVDFFGDKAFFPYSAFAIAAKTESPVIPLFICKDWESERYLVIGSETMRPVKVSGTPMTEWVRPWVQEYAKQLEMMIIKHPEQCFLFTDIWTK
ncbi:MAG: hypothetical protein A2020_15005 [Lentisphaerae bacterium GWF2_45_14]|nr:MAG: hypothetical protein A2020_15005 [Lentisphaerae bacterium GWF2_45_14]